MKKQSVVDYLQDEILKDRLVKAKSIKEWNDVFDKARNLYEETIKSAYRAGSIPTNGFPEKLSAEEYYNKKYKNN